jgi:hypothetical protein
LRSGESGFEILKALLERLPKVSGAMVSGEFNSPVLRDAEEGVSGAAQAAGACNAACSVNTVVGQPVSGARSAKTE